MKDRPWTQGPWEAARTLRGHEVRTGEAVGSPHAHPAHHTVNYDHDVYPTDGDGSRLAEEVTP
jgi:hypothetical protein